MEIVFAITFLGVAMVGILGLITQSMITMASAKQKTQASFLAQEAMEIAHNIRDTNYKKNLYPFDKNFYDQTGKNGWYQLKNYDSANGAGWELAFKQATEADDGTTLSLDGKEFKRYIKVTADTDGNAGTPDETSKRLVTVTVKWDKGKVESSTILTNWYNYPYSIGVNLTAGSPIDSPPNKNVTVTASIMLGSELNTTGDYSWYFYCDRNDAGVNTAGFTADFSYTTVSPPTAQDRTCSYSTVGTKVAKVIVLRNTTVGEVAKAEARVMIVLNPSLEVIFAASPSTMFTNTAPVFSATATSFGLSGDYTFKFYLKETDSTPCTPAITTPSNIASTNACMYTTPYTGNAKVEVIKGGAPEISKTIPVTVFSDPVVKYIAAGPSHSLAIKLDKSLWVTGQGDDYQLGHGATNDYYEWKQTAIANAKAVSAGEKHSMVLKEDNKLFVAGAYDLGQLGIGSNMATIWTESLTDVKAMAAGSRHSIVVKNDGTVWTTGQNQYGQLGHGDKINRDVWTKTSLTDAKAVCGGNGFSLALKNDGTVWSVGYNFNGALGLGDNGDRWGWTKTSLGNIASISCNIGFHSMALKNDGAVWVTGNNGWGQLGLGDKNSRNSWTQTLTGAKAIGAGSMNSFAIKNDGSIFSTGYNMFCLASDQVSWFDSGSVNAQSVIAGSYHAIALNNTDKVMGLGRGVEGQMGGVSGFCGWSNILNR
ncbi:MAG: Regulator of chromosome condensation RCC1 [candidate division CPR2 bacterium GW2011_GWD1_39_7]|nr:MAG: Regulator of chromosome condensation RCC1 [candidate division CPR2 bacterium GW2011_GWD1_39_7]